ncbi:MAG: energy transducer TonB [Pseudomonadota bacterium]
MSTRSQPLQVSASDRLGLTLFLALALHALVILGVGFDLERFAPESIPLSLEITLVHSSDQQEPDEADMLAQANQEGGGNIEEKRRPSSPAFNPLPDNERGDAEQSTPMAAPPSEPETQQDEVMLATESEQQVEQPQEVQTPPTPPAPTAAELMMRSRAIARLSAQIEQRQQAYSQKERSTVITARTREYRYAAYMDAWRQKVERVGNLNYPDEAKRQRLSGHLTLSVKLRPDGSVERVEVLRSSGHKVLDDGAVRIVKMAAPFNPFPPDIRKDNDSLEIIRVWQFQNDSFQQARP